jgi:hypothetical protein
LFWLASFIVPVAGVPSDSFVKTTDETGRAKWAWASTQGVN